MIGREWPVVGKEIRICRATTRPGDGITSGLIDMTGVGVLMGISVAWPINAWSVGFWGPLLSLAAVAKGSELSCIVVW
jgi:hypothetical protein